MALLIYGMQVMTSTVEEKTNRINEVLVSSLSPFQLLMGKVLGVGSVGLLQLSIWAGTAYVLSSQRERIGRMLGAGPEAVAAMPIPVIPAEVFAVFLLFFVLGFLFYAAAYAAVGSACNTVQETQQVSAPLTVLIVVGLMLMFRLLDEPSGTMGRIMSLVPPFAPFVTPVRNSLSPPLGRGPRPVGAGNDPGGAGDGLGGRQDLSGWRAHVRQARQFRRDVPLDPSLVRVKPGHWWRKVVFAIAAVLLVIPGTIMALLLVVPLVITGTKARDRSFLNWAAYIVSFAIYVVIRGLADDIGPGPFVTTPSYSIV
jgi:hypothetical protein